MDPDLYQPDTPSGAVISDDELYRYVLWRTWDPALPRAVYCMLNPSTADGNEDDNTIRRCTRFARELGFGGYDVVNLYAYRATEPLELVKASEPQGTNADRIIGPENGIWWADVISGADVLICAWGAWWNGTPAKRRPKRNSPVPLAHGFDVLVKCLGTTKEGAPRHPLYLPAAAKLEPFDGV